jgi:hypothetical protein
VPSEDCLGRDEERSPELSGYESGQEGEQGTVGPGEAGTGDLAAEHGQLVAQNKDFCILGRSIRPMDANDLKHAPEQTVEEGQGHGGSLTGGCSSWSNPVGGFRTLQGATDVFHEQDEVHVVGRAGLELGYEVKVEISRLFRLGVDDKAPATDVVSELDQTDEDVLEQAGPESVALMIDVDAEPRQ